MDLHNPTAGFTKVFGEVSKERINVRSATYKGCRECNTDIHEIPTKSHKAWSLLKLALLAENPKMIFRSCRFDISLQRELSQRKKGVQDARNSRCVIATYCDTAPWVPSNITYPTLPKALQKKFVGLFCVKTVFACFDCIFSNEATWENLIICCNFQCPVLG